MSFVDVLEDTNSIVCMGCDPELKKVPLEVKKIVYDKLSKTQLDHAEIDVEGTLTTFYTTILDLAFIEHTPPGAIKPNYAFWAQHDDAGLRALKNVVSRRHDIPFILDAKRGDIGKTSSAYAEELFGVYRADAVTVAPYMGSDSIRPFIDSAANLSKGVYVLCRTSNKGGADLQNLMVSGELVITKGDNGNEIRTVKEVDARPLYMHVARKIAGEWREGTEGTVGAVVGATSLAEFKEIVTFFAKQNEPPPLLIPGVGAQGGSAKDVSSILREVGYPLKRCRINSSGGINWAYEKDNSLDWAQAAVDEIKKMDEEIGSLEG